MRHEYRGDGLYRARRLVLFGRSVGCKELVVGDRESGCLQEGTRDLNCVSHVVAIQKQRAASGSSITSVEAAA